LRQTRRPSTKPARRALRRPARCCGQATNGVRSDAGAPMTDVVWSEQGTTPDAIEAALRALLVEQHAQNRGFVPARVLNMIACGCALRAQAYVVDLAGLRATPWRERGAAAFDPPRRRGELDAITAVAVRHHPASTVAALLLAGWLASRLGWRVEPLLVHGEAL